MKLTPVLCVLLSTAAPVMAQVSATPEGAARIEASLRKVLGPLPGVVVVTPQGETYEATMDFTPLIKLIPVPELQATMTPYTVVLTDKGDGTWGVREDNDFRLDIVMPDVFEAHYVIESIKGEGIFDESLLAMSEYKAELSGFSISSRMRGFDGMPGIEDTSTIERATIETYGVSDGGGGVDAEMYYSYENYRQTTHLPMGGPGASPLPLTFTVTSQKQHVQMSSLRTGEILDLISFFVDRPDPQKIIADQEVLRSKLSAAMPLFGLLEGSVTAQTVGVDSPVGRFEADEMGVSVGLQGVTADGWFTEGLSVKGLKVPAGLMPDWAQQLMPADVTLGFDVAGYDLANPAKILIDAFDFTKPSPIDPSLQMPLFAAFLPKGSLDIKITPSAISSDLYGVEAEGQFTAGPMGAPTGRVLISATGLDAVDGVLDQASSADPDAAGVRGMTGIARSLAKEGANGALTWELEFTPDQKVLVNGNVMSGMQ